MTQNVRASFFAKTLIGLLATTICDIVMPGAILSDFVDQGRTTAFHCTEHEPDTAEISIDIKIFDDLTRDYLSSSEAIRVPDF